MAGLELSEVLPVAFAGVQKMLSGKKFPQNVRALKMVAEEILRYLSMMWTLQCTSETSWRELQTKVLMQNCGLTAY